MATDEKTRFKPVGSGFDLPEVEHGVLDLWEREKSFDALRRKGFTAEQSMQIVIAVPLPSVASSSK